MIVGWLRILLNQVKRRLKAELYPLVSFNFKISFLFFTLFDVFLEVVKVYKDKIESSNERFHEILSEEKSDKLLEKMEKQVS